MVNFNIATSYIILRQVMVSMDISNQIIQKMPAKKNITSFFHPSKLTFTWLSIV